MSYRIAGQGKGWTVIQADILDYLAESLWLRQYDGAFFHFLFDDWPYHLDSIAKRFGGPHSAPAQFGRDGAFARQSRGFMGQTWDTDLAYQPDTWQAILPHLYPGAFTASFSHPRKQHRLAIAQEVAGYVLNPALYQLGWCYSSGKPNGSNISKLIDNRAGAKREVIGPGKHHSPGRVKAFGTNGIYGKSGKDMIGDGKWETTSATPLAQTWAGHQYGSPLAPELEPVIIAQAPWGKDRLTDVTTTGAGAVNIEAGKNGMPGRGHPGHLIITHHPGCVYRGEKMIKNSNGGITGEEPSIPAGKHVYRGGYKRTPYQAKGDENGMLAVPDYDCHPDCPAARLDAQTSDEKSYHFYQADWQYDEMEYEAKRKEIIKEFKQKLDDYVPPNKWQYEITERLAEINPVFYHGKVTAAERNAGLNGLPLQERRRVNSGGLEREKRFSPTMQHNAHPTLKPIALTKWIAGLFLPPIEYAPRRCLIPTCGTGSEMIGALLAGWDEVIGVELSSNYAEIACCRLEWWSDWLRWGQTDPAVILAAEQNDPKTQLELFG